MMRGLRWLALFAGVSGFLLLGPARMEWWVSFVAGCAFAFLALALQQQDDAAHGLR